MPKGSGRVLAVPSGFPTFTGPGTLSSLGREKIKKQTRQVALSPLFSEWEMVTCPLPGSQHSSHECRAEFGRGWLSERLEGVS